MKKYFFILLLSSIALLVGFHKSPPQPYKNFSVQQLSAGVWAVIQNDKGGHAICNAGIVDLGDKTLVFDAFINPDAAAELKQAAEKLTHCTVAYVVNSHYHDDHIRGNQVFMPGASIISTEWTKREMQKSEPEEQGWARKNNPGQLLKSKQQLQVAVGKEKEEALMWFGYFEAISQSLPKLKSFFPTITFNDSLWFHGSKREVLLIECKNGHTGSDAVMILPKEGIVFMGDLLFTQRHPWLGDGDPDSWKSHLEKLYNDSSLKQFVPGHGPVAGKDQLQIIIKYINDLQQMATEAVQNGIADSVFVKKDIPAAYKDWWYGRFYSGNLRFVYSKAVK